MGERRRSGAEPRAARAGRSPARVRRPRWRVWLGRVLWLWSLGIAAAFALFAVLLVWYGRDLPDLEVALAAYDPPQVTRVLARDHETVLGEVFQQRRTRVAFDQMPPVLLKAVVAAEDADFYRHEGLDYPGLLRALWANLVAGGYVQGGSTITQQVVKNLLLSPEQTLERKFKELLLAREMEQSLEKDEILALYLNHINFGDGRYGVEEAARHYFGKHVADLDLAEAAMLAGIPKAPSHYSPIRDPVRARERRAYVLRQMVTQGLLPEADARAAEQAPLRVVAHDAEAGSLAPEMIAVARGALADVAAPEKLRRGGFTVETTIDAAIQRATRAALRKGLEALDARNGDRAPLTIAGTKRLRVTKQLPRAGRTHVGVVVGSDDAAERIEVEVGGVRGFAPLASGRRWNPAKLPASRFAEKGAHVRLALVREAREGESAEFAFDLGPQGAVVVLDVRTRDVLALAGGWEVPALGFDRAMSARRQPGSAFKPFVYAQALRRRMVTPATIVADAPEVFDRWRPQNFETWSFRGPIRVREAVAQSVNLVAVRVMRDVGPESVVDFAHDLGIESTLQPDLALALGASEVTLLELVGAYGAFASYGLAGRPRLVAGVRGPDRRLLRGADDDGSQRVMEEAEAFLVTSLLESVVQSGTASAARALRRPVAGKTGTSNDARDAWFVGYTPELVCGVWVGYDDHRPLGRREAGGRTALPIWLDVMRAATAGRAATAFRVPEGVESARIDPASGLLAWEGQTDTIDEWFLSGTAPTEHATPPDVTTPEDFLLQEGGAPVPAPATVSPGTAGL